MPLLNGILVNCPECFEPEATAAFREWLAETSCKTYMCGPLVPATEHAMETEKKQSAEYHETSLLLNSALSTYGPNSLIYVSLELQKHEHIIEIAYVAFVRQRILAFAA